MRVTIVRRSPHRKIRLLAGVVPHIAAGHAVGSATVKGFAGSIGSSVGSSAVLAISGGAIGTITATATASGVFNVSASVGSSNATTFVSGIFSASPANAYAFTVTSVQGIPGGIGTIKGTSTAGAVGSTEVADIGTQVGFQERIHSLLPPSWFDNSDGFPVLTTLEAGDAYPLLWIYILYEYVIAQARIASSSGVWLDRIAYDFFGFDLPRLTNESDETYSERIRAAILAPRQTKEAISIALTFLTGHTPQVLEFWNPGDTGTYTAGSILTAGSSWSPSNVTSPAVTFGNNNLTVTGSSSQAGVVSTTQMTTGKLYFEATLVGSDGTGNTAIGVSQVYPFGSGSLASELGATSQSWGYYADSGNFLNGNSIAENAAVFSTVGNVVSIAVDIDSGHLWIALNGVWQDGDPNTGVNPSFTGVTGPLYAAASVYKNGAWTANFGASSFAYALPTGFSAWAPTPSFANAAPGAMGYGVSGMYGSLLFNNQVFVTAYRPTGEGISTIGGYGNPQSGYGPDNTGEYGDLGNINAQVTDADIYANVASNVAAGITAWTAIFTKPILTISPTAYFGDVENTQLLAVMMNNFF